MPNTKPVGVAYSDPELSGGTLNDTVIGDTTAAAGTFTNLTATGNCLLGNAAADTVGLHGAAGVVQSAFVATQSINALSVSGVVGFTSSTSLSSVIEKLNSVVTTLVGHGLMAAS